MPSRPDLRDIATNITDAFADADRETLLGVLTFVVKEYVVEGPPPMLVHQAETLSDLKGISFAQLVTALQARFDFPELAMFVVDNEHVGVRIGGVVQPLVAARQPLTGGAAELPRPSAGVHVVETTLPPRPPTQAPAAAAAPANTPPPVRGLQMRSRPGDAGTPVPSTPPPATAAVPAPAASGPAPASTPGTPAKESPSGDDAAARFSLLELD